MKILALLLALLLQQASEPSPTPEASSGAPEAPLRHELPWELRRDLPELRVTVWQAGREASERFVIINGETYRETDTTTDGIRVVSIHENGVVLEFAGTRFRIE